MNTETRESLEGLLAYWQRETGFPWREESIKRCQRLLTSKGPLSDDQLDEYFGRLAGPEGCNFHQDERGETVWHCGGGTDKSKSESILTQMGFDAGAVASMHELVDELGGHCDCEILWNAAGRMGK